MRRFHSKLAVISVLSCAVILSFALSAGAGEPAPSLELHDLKGVSHKLEDFRGRPVVLNFWATWCVPCATEMPLLSEMQNRYQGKVLFIAASIDDDDMKPAVEAFIKKHHGEALTVMMGATLDSLEDFGVQQVMPGTVFIDAEGNIVDRLSGALKRTELEQRLRKLAGEPETKSNSARGTGPSQDDWDWVSKNYAGVLDEFVPLKVQGGLYLSYRSYRDLHTEVLEYGFFIGFESRPNGPGLQEFLTARVRIADTVSIYDQLMKMHRTKPEESVESIQHQLKVKTWNLNEKTCPAIQEQFQRLKRLKIHVPKFNEFVMHPLIHQFHVEAGAGNMDLILDDSTRSAVRWALETRKELDSCIVSSRRSVSLK